jgi:toxin ParE1/3/4
VQVIWSPASLRDIDHIYRYIAQFNPWAAENLVKEMLAAGDALEHFPHRGRLVPSTQLREIALPYAYIIRYRAADNHVRILRVRHGVRRPMRP